MSGFAAGQQKKHHPRVEEVYDLGQQLGKGSFSTVYIGIHRETQEKVALKVISARAYRGQERAKQLLRTEVAVMTKIRNLNHPNLMQFKHTFEDSEKIVMVLELLADELFMRIVQKGHYTERDASQLTKVLVGALDALHGIGILHRDLKPENCIFANALPEAPLKLTDFGLAALMTTPGEKIHDRHLVGTPGYIAPEILTSYDYSPASDMWSAGVITFILLSGSPPFYGRNHPEIFDRIRRGRWGFNGRNWGQVSESAKDLVRKMLSQDPKQRISAKDIMEHPWIRGHDQPGTHLGDTIEDLKKFNARQKFRAAALACIASTRMTRILVTKAADKLDDLVEPTLLSSEELSTLQREFSLAVNELGTRTLNYEAFEGVMKKLKLDHLPLDRIFKLFDVDGGGDIDIKEFLLGISKFRLKGEDAVKFCFKIFDEDQSGSISREELTKVLVHTRRKSRAQNLPTSPRAAPHPAGQLPPTASSGSLLQSADMDDTSVRLTPPPEDLGDLAGRTGEPPSAIMTAMEENGGVERFDERFMEMDADAYEIAEGIARIFDSLDEDGDNQVSLDEFLNGVKRHPELIDLFFKADPSAGTSSALFSTDNGVGNTQDGTTSMSIDDGSSNA